jgi:ATP-dependent helicase/nuclease subunit B
VRDPYAVYARRILGLRRLERPDEPVEARARGTAIHAAFEAFAAEWEGLDRDMAPARFAELYMAELEAEAAPEALLAREAVLARRAGGWVAQMEAARRRNLLALYVEAEGEIAVDGLTLTCRADRLEAIRDGAVNILDFKTGRVPSKKEIDSDFAPQLTLTAAILQRGGFAMLGPREPGDLVYLRVQGREPPGAEEVRAHSGESAAMAEAALAGLRALHARYGDPATPYRSRVAPRFVKVQVSDFDHLARVREWSAADDEEEA